MLFLRYYLWITPNVLLAVFLGCLLRRKLFKQFPIFTAYVGFEVAHSLALITIGFLLLRFPSWLASYRWVLVVGTGMSSILASGALFELANELLKPRSPTLVRVWRSALQWMIAILLLASVFISAFFSANGLERVVGIFQAVDFSSNLIGVGILLALLVFTRFLHISWRSLPAGIALGFGLSGTAELAASALFSMLGRRGYVDIDLIRMAGSQVCVLIWMVYMFLPERAPSFDGTQLQMSDLEFWDRELQRMVQR